MDEAEVDGEVLDIWGWWHLNGIRAVKMIMAERVVWLLLMTLEDLKENYRLRAAN